MRLASKPSSVGGGSGDVVSAVERGLFKSALDFYGAAGGLIAFDHGDRPALSWDIERLQEVRAAMGALERRIAIALRAGLSTERIISITRLERELVERIAEHAAAAPRG
jgi:hypothetical protein